MSTPTKVASLRAIDQLKEELIKNCKEAHLTKDKWGNYTSEVQPTVALENARNEINARISKEIEDYAIKTYAKYGLIVVPVCHRTDYGPDRLNIQLKAKKFPGTEKLEEAVHNANVAYLNDKARIDSWYFNALQAVAKREALPELPAFEVKHGA